MKKKTLKEKINRVCWWAAGLTILYFIVGAFLKSDGPKFDPNKTYELIRDTLTLTAAFLAPVAAFVLFSDWREEHKVKSLFELLDSVKNKAREIEESLIDYAEAIEHRKIEVNEDVGRLTYYEITTKHLIQFSLLYREIEEENMDLSAYMKIMEKL